MAIDKKYGKDSSQVRLSMFKTQKTLQSKVALLFSLITDVPWVTGCNLHQSTYKNIQIYF